MDFRQISILSSLVLRDFPFLLLSLTRQLRLRLCIRKCGAVFTFFFRSSSIHSVLSVVFIDCLPHENYMHAESVGIKLLNI
jgi:hypothetical protein